MPQPIGHVFSREFSCAMVGSCRWMQWYKRQFSGELDWCNIDQERGDAYLNKFPMYMLQIHYLSNNKEITVSQV